MANKPADAAKKVANAVSRIVTQLEDLTPEERKRAVDAALTVFGDVSQGSSSRAEPTNPQGAGMEELPKGLSAAGLVWIKKNRVNQEQIEQAFHVEDGKVTLILGEAAGKSAREKTINTYLLTGVAAMLESGSAHFADETARTNCENLGCYDGNNHAKYMRDFGNKITGSKNAGWKLTGPGLAAAAAALKPVEPENK